MAIKFSTKRTIPHPLGVKPMGNLYMCADPQLAMQYRRCSLGMFASVSEETQVEIFSFLSQADLGTLSAASNYLCAFASFDELWRELFWPAEGEVRFGRTWKESCEITCSGKKRKFKNIDEISVFKKRPLTNVFSDLLYSPFRPSGMSRAWLGSENIDRRSSVTDFVAEYEVPNRPMILTEYIDKSWPDFPKSVAEMLQLDDSVYSCGPVSMTLRQFQEYINSSELCEVQESPYFVFDAWAFGASRMKKLYTVPPIFKSDLFDLLDPPYRPDNAWLLVGPANAASKWHVDPNGTNAWNGVVSGAKRWLMLPPHLGPPPGVSTSSDGFAVRQPLHLSEWFDSFYEETVRMHGPSGSRGLVECTCRAGEIVFVPRGWWHCVRNVETSIAVTQNYAAESSLRHVELFLKKFPHCVSGIEPEFRPQLRAQFEAALRSKRPDLCHIEELVVENAAEGGSFWGNLGSKSLEFSR